MRAFLLLILLLALAACARAAPAPVLLPPAPPMPEALRVYSAAEVRAGGAAWQGQRVTVRGVVTSVEPSGLATLQSGGAGLLLSGVTEARLAQEVIVTGQVGEVAGNLALLAPEEWIVEEAQGAFPEPLPLVPSAEQESVYVEVRGPSVGADGTVQGSDGQRLRVRALDEESARRLAPGARLDALRGVLRRVPGGWELLPPLPRDVVVAPPLLAICELQGTGKESPWRAKRVETVGVVTASFSTGEAAGFFLQAPACDADPQSSDGIFVAAAGDLPQVGDRVRVRGEVRESYARTQIVAETLWVEASAQPLPAPIPLQPPDELEEAARYFEALEGMLVTLERARVVGPTSRFGEFAVAPAAQGATTGRVLRSGALGPLLLVDDEGAFGPYELAVGDEVRGLLGPLDYTFGAYKMQLIAAPELRPQPAAALVEAVPLAAGEWSVVSFNVENLFDSVDDPATGDTILSEAERRTKLDKIAATLAGPLGLPTIVALQEVENLAVLEELAAHPSLGGRYEARLIEGSDGRGIDVALLVERGRVRVLEMATGNPCSPLATLGGGKRGTCPAGQRELFARPPLIARLQVDGSEPFYLVVCHFKSKSGGESETLPRRVAQARFVSDLLQQLRAANPQAEMLVLGDLNDFEDSLTLTTLTDASVLENLWATLPASERYGYIYLGVSQVLDHILATPRLRAALVAFRPVHLNADFPHALHADPATPRRTSDHDPLLAVFRAGP